MMCTCKPENVEKVLEIFDMWDVIATPIAKTTDKRRTRLFWNGELIFDMDLEFLTGGPVYNRPYVLPKVSSKKNEKFPKLPSDKEVILAMLSDFNVASKEWAIRQYDHEVRASTAIHPMVGELNKTGPGDASVLLPVPGSKRGLAAAIGCNPWFCEADPYKGGMAAIDETCRNIVAVGAMPNAFTDCLNFGNPEIPERLGVFREAVRGLGEIARELNIPIPSGNVSLYNEAPGGKHILPTPMLLGCGIIDDITKAVTADFKRVGSCIFIVGKTKDEMGASLLFRKFGGVEGDVPGVDIPALKRNMSNLLKAMDKRLVLSCHDCSDGGLAIAVAEMCISGQIGAQIDLSAMDGELRTKLYSESNSRWIVEVDGKDVTEFTKIMGDDAQIIGITKGDELVIKDNGTVIPVEEMRRAWNDPIWNIMGGVSE
jgi:phosphoribosylformylglycinamidine synthase